MLKSPYLHMDETVARIAGYQKVHLGCRNKEFGAVLSIHTSWHGAENHVLHVCRHCNQRRIPCLPVLQEAAKMLGAPDEGCKGFEEKSEYAVCGQLLLQTQGHTPNGQGKEGGGSRSGMARCMDAKLGRLLSYYSRYEDLLPVIKTIRNDRKAWFTFMLYSYVDPTNNWAELLVREVVKQRIMRQALRTMEGGPKHSRPFCRVWAHGICLA